ncbi:MAG: cold shock domain-containing protein [Xanthomonadales bacterium]|nr:cold shock domain-containing protein [Xanthomonadales bacterium]
MIEKGEVVFWNERGFGFIRPDADGENVFIHRSDLRDASYLREGDHVEFEARMAERGRRADYARLVS